MAAGLALALAVFLVVVSLAWMQPPAVPPLRDPARIAQGAAVYARHCAACHGAHLEGQPDWRRRRPDDRMPAPPHEDSGHTWHHANAVLFDITRRGMAARMPAGDGSGMPAFGEVLSDDEIWAVLAFIQSRWSERARSAQQEIDRQHARRRR